MVDVDLLEKLTVPSDQTSNFVLEGVFERGRYFSSRAPVPPTHFLFSSLQCPAVCLFLLFVVALARVYWCCNSSLVEHYHTQTAAEDPGSHHVTDVGSIYPVGSLSGKGGGP